MMVEEFEFYRKVRTYYCNVAFSVQFTYLFSYRHNRTASANGTFSCSVNAHSQTVEYIMDLKSDVIERPYSERNNLLFTNVYEQIPPQAIEYIRYPIYKMRYRVPIDYDWQQFVIEGGEAAINVKSMQALFKKWKLLGADGSPVEANLKVAKVSLHW
jgi:hypothetical protein